jgi:hypothetical protein
MTTIENPADASGVASTAGLGGCPRCGDTDLYAAAPDWTDTGISAEMTCPRCEHQWTAKWSVTLLTPNAALTGARPQQEHGTNGS